MVKTMEDMELKSYLLLIRHCYASGVGNLHLERAFRVSLGKFGIGVLVLEDKDLM